MSHPLNFPRTNKKHCNVPIYRVSMLTEVSKTLSYWDKKRQEQRGDMLLSPVCVPSVCKLHQQHELDQQEDEPTNGSHVAPHC